MSFLGIFFSGSTMYILASNRIKLANCQNLLIVNVAAIDVIISMVGVFRGLGIIDSKFVGAPNYNTTVGCVTYTILLNSFTASGMLALLPLTIDRTVAIILPLRHNFLITRKTCYLMFGVVLFPVFVLLLSDTVAYTRGTIKIQYYKNYQRCVISEGRESYIELVAFIFIPFLLILKMYITMLFIVIRNRRRCGRFLVTATGIIMTGVLSYFPTMIADIWSVPMSYELSQILTITLFYTNGIVNPLIYFLSHPVARRYVFNRMRWMTDSLTSHFGAWQYVNVIRTLEFTEFELRNLGRSNSDASISSS